MFFKQIKRNASRNRKGNGLYFGSLTVAIIAFYTLLSIQEQDIMKFLNTIESDAVHKLLMLIRCTYLVSLFFVFFLVYFACKYQMESRRHEFGMYLMLGMKKSRLFFMLFGETLLNSFISLAIGIPSAVFLTEAVSIISSKLIGLDFLSHSFSLSFESIIWTVCGFLIVQILSLFIICIPYGNTEPAIFMTKNISKSQKRPSTASSIIFFVLGVICLLTAYYIGIFRLIVQTAAWIGTNCAITLILGTIGTFFVYKGLGGFIGKHISKTAKKATGLKTFTSRQIQESILNQHKSIAVCSLLLMIALSCISYGIAVGTDRVKSNRTTDFSLYCTEAQANEILSDDTLKSMTETSYPVMFSRINTDIDISEFIPDNESDNILTNAHIDYIISLSSYNKLLSAIGKQNIDLQGNQVALCSNLGEGDVYKAYRTLLSEDKSITINNTKYMLTHNLYTDNFIADRHITVYGALIVNDTLYDTLKQDNEVFCYNIHLKKSVTDDLGLMKAIQQADSIIKQKSVHYDSYLSGIGRNLFYTVAAGYLTIYLGILFLLISNTAIGTKYLIQQRENRHRFVTLQMLGADMTTMCKSARKQIDMFFSLVLSLACINSIIGILVLFSNFTRLPEGTELTHVILLAGIALVCFIVIEYIYILIVKHNACKDICSIEITDRG